GSAVNALEEIVADERVLGDATAHAAHEGVDVVDALADVDPRAEEILIELRDRVRVDVEADVAREDAREEGLPRGRRRRLDARLNDRVSGNDTAGVVEDRAVERMREQADQAVRALHRKLRVAVERDDVSNSGQALRMADVARVARLQVPAEQPIELLELSAFALPAHVP